jgi:predicted 3-demethylubiquinone-9 3-methyltransferase (glyoxalase superfamily)
MPPDIPARAFVPVFRPAMMRPTIVASLINGVSLVQKITPFLWFDKEAGEAANFYVSIFKDGKILNVSRYGDAGPGQKGQVMVVKFELMGQTFMALNGGPLFKFTEAISFMVDCQSQEEVDYYWDKLLSGGGKPSQCGWLKDKYGLSWQIVPTILGELMSDKDPAKSRRVMEAMLKMVKMDVAALKRAYEGHGA